MSESSADKRMGKTTEFILAMLTAVVVAINGTLAPEQQLSAEHVLGVAALVAAYATNRTLAKSTGANIRAGIKTLEFWTTLATGILLVGAEKLGLALGPEQVAGLVAVISSVVVGRGVQKKAATSP